MTTMNPFRMAIIGECMVEISDCGSGNLQLGFGGDTINTAVYLKRLMGDDACVSYVTAMGEDKLSQEIIQRWQEEGIDCQHVLKNPDKQAGLYFIRNDASGERTFQYWRNDAAARFVMQHPTIGSRLQALASYNAVYLSGISLAILPEADRLTLYQQLCQWRGSGVSIIFDSNYRPMLWESLDLTRTWYEKMYEIADLCLLTLEDESKVWGDIDVTQCQQRLKRFDIPELVIKDGPNGCYYTADSESLHYPTQSVGKVVDTTAAGDSFNAGFLAGWLLRNPTQQCAEWGNRLAGLVIQKKGAIVPFERSAVVN